MNNLESRRFINALIIIITCLSTRIRFIVDAIRFIYYNITPNVFIISQFLVFAPKNRVHNDHLKRFVCLLPGNIVEFRQQTTNENTLSSFKFCRNVCMRPGLRYRFTLPTATAPRFLLFHLPVCGENQWGMYTKYVHYFTSVIDAHRRSSFPCQYKFFRFICCYVCL